MKRATFNIIFFVKRAKLLKNGNAPIYLRLTSNGKSKEIAIKRSVPPNKWETKQNKVSGRDSSAKAINTYLESIRGQIFLIQRNLQEDSKEVTVKNILNQFTGKEEKVTTLVEVFNEHNSEMDKLIGIDYAPLTLQRYEACLKHIKTYLAAFVKDKDHSIKKIDYKFISGFENYLKIHGKCQHNTAMKHLTALKKILNIAVVNDLIKKNPFDQYKMSIKKVDREYLTQTELETLICKEFSIERLDKIRDLFVFQCYTGLAFKDLAALCIDHIKTDENGDRWIDMKRSKTGVSFKVPLFPVSEKIISKYKGGLGNIINNKLLPVPSNQKMNAYLKEIAIICKINKKLSTHIARHTFATTTTMSNGVPIETISKLLGHSKIQTTQIYAKVVDAKVNEDMMALRGRL